MTRLRHWLRNTVIPPFVEALRLVIEILEFGRESVAEVMVGIWRVFQ